MPPKSAKKQPLTFAQLAAYDDILTDALVDHVRLIAFHPIACLWDPSRPLTIIRRRSTGRRFQRTDHRIMPPAESSKMKSPR